VPANAGTAPRYFPVAGGPARLHSAFDNKWKSMKTALATAAAIALTCLTVAADDSTSSNTNAVPLGAKGNYETVQAKVVKVFAAEDNGAKFRAYQVKWKGFDVVIPSRSAGTDKKEGDLLTFKVRRTDPGKGRPLFLSFQAEGGEIRLSNRAPALTSTNETPASARGNPETVQAKVVKVFAADDNRAKFRAYQVKWKGFDVVVSDTLANTDTREGELLTFLVSRSFGMAPPTLHFTTMRGYRAK
jgi:hypothetical protein